MYILGGYQKTGTEWLKFILVNLFKGKQETWDAYDEMLPNLSVGKISPTDWYKTHAYCNHNSPGICQVRHPFDVCLSAYRYVTVIDNLEVPPLETFIDLFIANRGEITFNQMNGCDYVEHVEHWCDAHNTMVLKHEDLRSAGGAIHLQNALSHIGLYFDLREVRLAKEFASVGRMRNLDDRNFLGAVKSTWREVWTEDQRFRGRIAFRSIIERFGYDT